MATIIEEPKISDTGTRNNDDICALDSCDNAADKSDHVIIMCGDEVMCKFYLCTTHLTWIKTKTSYFVYNLIVTGHLPGVHFRWDLL